jgi:predicted nucleic acid-binding protein
MAYVDTSVLVAYYCPEHLSDAAEAAIRSVETPAISPLTEVEFFSALAIRARTGDMEPDAARRVLAQFRGHVEDRRFLFVPVGATEFVQACGWLESFSTPLRLVDALHLATASSHGLPLLTADKGLARSAEHFGVGCEFVS